MRKYRALMAILIIAAITATGCQVLSNGIVKKASCCEKLLIARSRSKMSINIKELNEVIHTAGSSDDILHTLPFSKIAL